MKPPPQFASSVQFLTPSLGVRFPAWPPPVPRPCAPLGSCSDVHATGSRFQVAIAEPTFERDTSSRFTAAFTLPRQHEPCGFRISQAQYPALISAVIRSGIVQRPVSRISSLTIASVKPKQ